MFIPIIVSSVTVLIAYRNDQSNTTNDVVWIIFNLLANLTAYLCMYVIILGKLWSDIFHIYVQYIALILMRLLLCLFGIVIVRADVYEDSYSIFIIVLMIYNILISSFEIIMFIIFNRPSNEHSIITQTQQVQEEPNVNILSTNLATNINNNGDNDNGKNFIMDMDIKMPDIKGIAINYINIESGVCPICLDKYDENKKIMILTCTHDFHVLCITEWLKSNFTCPICRMNSIK